MTLNASQTHSAAEKPAAQAMPELTPEDASKDRFFNELANIGNAMIAQHGRDFAIGSFVLAARFIAEGKSLSQPAPAADCCGGACKENHDHHKP